MIHLPRVRRDQRVEVRAGLRRVLSLLRPEDAAQSLRLLAARPAQRVGLDEDVGSGEVDRVVADTRQENGLRAKAPRVSAGAARATGEDRGP